MRIVFRERGQLAYADWSVTDFEVAKQMAVDAVDNCLADSVDVFGDDGKLLYHHAKATILVSRT